MAKRGAGHITDNMRAWARVNSRYTRPAQRFTARQRQLVIVARVEAMSQEELLEALAAIEAKIWRKDL